MILGAPVSSVNIRCELQWCIESRVKMLWPHSLLSVSAFRIMLRSPTTLQRSKYMNEVFDPGLVVKKLASDM